MSTNDVPGYNLANADTLAMGCWAKSANDDDSYIFVESVENGRVIFLIFDTSKGRVVEFRDAMDEASFKRTFSWDPTKAATKWTWHDKTPFPWDIVIKEGARPGARAASAGDVLGDAQDIADVLRDRIIGDDDTVESAASRVAADLGLRGRAVSEGTRRLVPTNRVRRALLHIRDGLQEAIDELRP
jgi:hypothetical protein